MTDTATTTVQPPTGAGNGNDDKESSGELTQKGRQTISSIMVPFVAVAWWVLILALPEEEKFTDNSRTAMAIAGGVLIAVGVAVMLFRLIHKGSSPAPFELGLYGLMIVIGICLLAAAWFTANTLSVSQAGRFTLGVGGLAIAAFAYGVINLSTIRAAASLPIVILFIGVAAWPDVRKVMPDDVREQLIGWMGVIIVGTGAVEAAERAVTAFARAKVTNSPQQVVESGDLDPVP